LRAIVFAADQSTTLRLYLYSLSSVPNQHGNRQSGSALGGFGQITSGDTVHESRELCGDNLGFPDWEKK
jgi:hypothetical protein